MFWGAPMSLAKVQNSDGTWELEAAPFCFFSTSKKTPRSILAMAKVHPQLRCLGGFNHGQGSFWLCLQRCLGNGRNPSLTSSKVRTSAITKTSPNMSYRGSFDNHWGPSPMRLGGRTSTITKASSSMSCNGWGPSSMRSKGGTSAITKTTLAWIAREVLVMAKVPPRRHCEDGLDHCQNLQSQKLHGRY